MDAFLPPGFSLSSPFEPSDFPDARLAARARRCLRASAQGHLTSFSASEALRKGKDRFCHNTRLPADPLLTASARAVPADWLPAPVVLVAEDSMLARAGGPRFKPHDVGPLRHAHDHGYMVHDAFGLTPGACFPQAWLGAIIWTRGWDLHLKDHQKRSPEERESLKWSQLRSQVHDRLRRGGFAGRIISLNDREGDNWTSLWRAVHEDRELITRATLNRDLEHGEGTLKAFLRSQPLSAQMAMPVYGSGPARRRPRLIQVQLRWAQVILSPPASAPADQSEPLPLVGVHLRQVGRVGKRKRFESFLLTTCPVDSDEQALEVVAWYSDRWSCEIGHDVLKNGLHVEDEPVDDVDAFKRLMALEGPVAAQVAQWVSLARQPKPPAVTKVFPRSTLDELRQACRFYRERAPVRWTVVNVVETLARLGGGDVRADRKPGWRVVLRGWTKFEEFRQILAFGRTGQRPERQARQGVPLDEGDDEEAAGWGPLTIVWKRKG